MKLSFNKQPVNNTSTNQLDMFSLGLEQGELVQFGNNYGVISSIDTFYTDGVKFTACNIYTYKDFYYKVPVEKVRPAKIERVYTVNQLQVGDILAIVKKHSKYIVKINYISLADAGMGFYENEITIENTLHEYKYYFEESLDKGELVYRFIRE